MSSHGCRYHHRHHLRDTAGGRGDLIQVDGLNGVHDDGAGVEAPNLCQDGIHACGTEGQGWEGKQ